MLVCTENVNQCAVEILKRWNTVILAVEKSGVTLNCPVKHCGGTPTLTWCKMKTTLYCMTVTETDKIKIEWKRDKTDPDISTSRLVFKHISMEDAGLYRCDVSGSAPPVGHCINITVTVLPAYGPRSELVAVLDSQLHTPTRLKQNQLHSSDCWWSRSADAPLIMSCRAAFENPATVTWCKQDGGLCTPLEDKDKYSLMWLQPSPAWGVSYLTVYNIGAADSGEYHCHASPAGPCVTGDVLSSPIRLLASGDVVKQCGRDVTVGILNIVQIVEITVLLGSFAAFNVYWRLKLSAYPKGRSSPVQVTEDDTPGGDPIQAETENDTELDYDDCAAV
ncbi:uncharacterized protein [Paramormyrops kingsleyae]|uniref:uncharacterized protein n=1 Tax=Paramormyrops kingsleyae TaxID=1676925 RepID=UPI003B9714BA